jgi:hypothetical protein
LLVFEPTRQPAHFLLRDLETTMNEEQEELFGQYIAEFALENDLKLDDDEIIEMVSVVWKKIYAN